MNLLITNVILSLFISLALHEFGHYLAARLCKIPVTQAGLGWGPKLLSARVNKVDCHLRLLPLGAYVQMDMTVLQSRPLLQQLFVLGAGVAVNLALSGLAWGTLFGALNLALAIGNTLPLYQYDGWKVGMVICRRIFGRPNPLVEWTFTLAGGLFGLAVIALAVLSFYAPK
jgi:membrane-associated protease RseP (regulator of RpoE activity)